MTVRPALALSALTAAAWTATITADALNLHEHVWTCCLAIAGASTFSLLQLAVSAVSNRRIVSLAKAAISRPLYRDQTGPLPVLQPVSLDERRRTAGGHHASAR